MSFYAKHGAAAAVKAAVERAKPVPVRRVKPLTEVSRVEIYKLPKLKTGIHQLDRLLGGGLYFGQVDIIAGKRGGWEEHTGGADDGQRDGPGI